MYGLKNIEKSTVLTLKEQVAYQPGQVVSKTLAQNDVLSVTLFAFDKGEEISTACHTSCTRASPSSCPRAIPTPSTVRSSSKCCWSWYSEGVFSPARGAGNSVRLCAACRQLLNSMQNGGRSAAVLLFKRVWFRDP